MPDTASCVHFVTPDAASCVPVVTPGTGAGCGLPLGHEMQPCKHARLLIPSLPSNPLPRRLLRSSLRQLHLRLQQGGSSKWVLYDTRSGEQAAEDESATAALLGGPSAATAGDAGAGAASPPQTQQQTSPAQQASPPQQQSAQQKVWIGFLGGPPSEADGWDAQQQQRQQQSPWQQRQQRGTGQQQPAHSPSKFVRLASGASPGPRKVLVS